MNERQVIFILFPCHSCPCIHRDKLLQESSVSVIPCTRDLGDLLNFFLHFTSVLCTFHRLKSTKRPCRVFHASFCESVTAWFPKSQKLLLSVVKQFVILYGNLHWLILRSSHNGRSKRNNQKKQNIVYTFLFFIAHVSSSDMILQRA